jgi:WD40 repeat protein
MALPDEEEAAKAESAVKTEKGQDLEDQEIEENGAAQDQSEGRLWRVQAHAKSSISAMKVDPINGSGVSLALYRVPPKKAIYLTRLTSQLYTSSYDCTLRHLDFATLKSTELLSLPDHNTLITHFDLTPSGQEAWVADKDGGISHVDFREGGGGRRRWVVQESGRGGKLGGISVNRMFDGS